MAASTPGISSPSVIAAPLVGMKRSVELLRLGAKGSQHRNRSTELGFTMICSVNGGMGEHEPGDVNGGRWKSMNGGKSAESISTLK